MTEKLRMLVDLSTVKFDEVVSNEETIYSSWIQAMPIGEWSHPQHGKISITAERVLAFANNVNNGVRGSDLDIDYDHKDKTNEAAGWVKRAEARLDNENPKMNGLWLLVEWTKKAAEAIKSKAYRYFSPEFSEEYTNPSNGNSYKDVLFGGGITNRPFLKGIQPLNLSEFYNEKNGETGMTPEQLSALAVKLGLPATATVEEVLEAINNLSKKEEPKEQELSSEEAHETESLNEHDVKGLSEHPTTKKLMELMEAQQKQLNELRINDTIKKLSERAAEKGYGLPVPSEDALRSVLSATANNVQLSESVVSVIDKIIEHGLVALGESGSTSRRDTEVTGTNKLEERIKSIMASENLSYADAAIKAVNENPDAFDEHRVIGE